MTGSCPRAATFTVTFTESGLASGTDWYVNVTAGLGPGPSLAGAGKSLSVSLPNGSYTYNPAASGYVPVPIGGSFEITGSPLSISVRFSRSATAYEVTFTETGLPATAEWTVSVVGIEGVTQPGGTPIEFALTNGPYSYTVADVNSSLAARGGLFTVDDADLGVPVAFLSPSPVTFSETGLPSNDVWWVNQSGEPSIEVTTTTSIYSVPNGTYSYAVQASDRSWGAYGGAYRVSGSPVTVPVTFEPVNCTVTFAETGLPTGTTWYVNLTGEASLSGAGTTLSTTLSNGTYNFTAASASGAWGAVGTTIDTTGTALTVPVPFSPASSSATFTETGLPSGTVWYVNISGEPSLSGSVASLGIDLPVGDFNYSVGSANTSWAAPPGAFSITGPDTGIALSVTFSRVTYVVALAETGLPSGTKWYVNVTGGPSVSGKAAHLSTSASNGTYTYTVATENKSFAAPPGEFTVSGAVVHVAIVFSLQRYTVTFGELGLPKASLAKGWTVVLNGTVDRGTTSTLNFTLPNGTYQALVLGPAGYVWAGASGTTNVSGATHVAVPFAKGRTVTLTFGEKHLPNGQSWCVEVDLYGQCTSLRSVKYANLTPGLVYDYAVVSPLVNQTITAKVGTTVVPTAGALTFTGSEKVVLTFAYPYAVSFTQSGLTSGAWSVSIKGTMRTVLWNASIVFDLTNGSYGYAVGKEPGYTAVGSPKAIDVSGAPVSVSVTFSSKGKHPTYVLGMSAPTESNPASGVYYAAIALAPSAGLTTGMFGLDLLTASDVAIPGSSADVSCKVGASLSPTTCGAPPSGGWYAVLYSLASDTIANVYASGAWAGAPVTVTGAMGLIVVSSTSYAGTADTLQAFATGSATVSGTSGPF